jgi:hypothetical protein
MGCRWLWNTASCSGAKGAVHSEISAAKIDEGGEERYIMGEWTYSSLSPPNIFRVVETGTLKWCGRVDWTRGTVNEDRILTVKPFNKQ